MINKENFFKKTSARFKGCNIPNKTPDFISYNKNFFEYLKYVDKKTRRKFEIRTPTDFKYLSQKILDEYGVLSYERWKSSKYSKNKVSSAYWYGENSKGAYVIRLSDHWSDYKDFDNQNKTEGCGNIVDCNWSIKTNNHKKLKAGKAYFKDFK